MLAYDRTGNGPPLVLLHPLGADRRVWDPIVARLRDRRELIAVDLPGFGESPAFDRLPTPRALAAAVAEQLRRARRAPPPRRRQLARRLGRARARARRRGADRDRHRPRRPVAGTAGPQAGDRPPPGRRAGCRWSARWPRTRAGRRLLLSSAVAHPGRIPGPDASHLVRAYGSAPGFKAVNDQMRAGVFSGLERIRVPVTLVWPEHDRLVARPPWLPDNVRNVDARRRRPRPDVGRPRRAGRDPARPPARSHRRCARSRRCGAAPSLRVGRAGEVGRSVGSGRLGGVGGSTGGLAADLPPLIALAAGIPTTRHSRGAEQQRVVDRVRGQRSRERDAGQAGADRRAEQPAHRQQRRGPAVRGLRGGVQRRP